MRCASGAVAIWALTIIFVLVVVSISVTVLVPSPSARNVLSALPPQNPTYTYITDAPEPITTTEPVVATTTTATPVTTTPIPGIAEINMTCPADVVVVLGFSLEPTYTGGSPTDVSGGCTLPGPVIQFEDTVVLDASPSKRKTYVPPDLVSSRNHKQQQQRVIDNSGLEYGVAATGVVCTSLDASFVAAPLILRRKIRSPSFNYTDLDLIDAAAAFGINGGPPRSDATLAVGPDRIALAYNGDSSSNATYINIVIKSNMSPSYLYPLGSLGIDNCSYTAPTRGQGQVIWDYEAHLWVALELAAAGSGQLCVYVSNTADLDSTTWRAFVFVLPPSGGSTEFDFPQLSVWGDSVYTLTFNGATKSLCVLDRAALLAFTSFNTSVIVSEFNTTTNTTTNTTVVVDTPLPGLFCAAPFTGTLPGLKLQSWAAVHVESSVLPAATRNTNADDTTLAGALFMRAIDDELHYGAATPHTDQLEVEHWYGVNFTTATYNARRYKVAVNDFDHSPSYGSVPTPTAYKLDLNPLLGARALYRRIEASAQESVVFSTVSHGARVYWFELRWVSPALNTAPLWTLYQQGNVTYVNDALRRWMPAINMDGNGTIMVAYETGSATHYPSVAVSSRLANDPLGELRTELVLVAGGVGSTLDSTDWGRAHAVATDPVTQRRDFYVAGDVSGIGIPWLGVAMHTRVKGEVITRTWTAADYCGNSMSCVQTITAE